MVGLALRSLSYNHIEFVQDYWLGQAGMPVLR
jgi:hypothetical protein